MARTTLLAACLALLAGAPCRAQDQPAGAPSVLPSRDVQVVYRVSGAAADAIPRLGQSPLLRLSWDAAGSRLRVAPEGQDEAAIVDLRAGEATVVDPALHTALVLTMRPQDVSALRLEGARFIPAGRDTVLGRGCMLWTVRAARGSGTLCLTDDGVPLRGSGRVQGRQGSFAATSLSYGSLPADLFTVPADAFRLRVPDFSRQN